MHERCLLCVCVMLHVKWSAVAFAHLLVEVLGLMQ